MYSKWKCTIDLLCRLVYNAYNLYTPSNMQNEKKKKNNKF